VARDLSYFRAGIIEWKVAVTVSPGSGVPLSGVKFSAVIAPAAGSNDRCTCDPAADKACHNSKRIDPPPTARHTAVRCHFEPQLDNLADYVRAQICDGVSVASRNSQSRPAVRDCTRRRADTAAITAGNEASANRRTVISVYAPPLIFGDEISRTPPSNVLSRL